jgi:hypothetical protein
MSRFRRGDVTAVSRGLALSGPARFSGVSRLLKCSSSKSRHITLRHPTVLALDHSRPTCCSCKAGCGARFPLVIIQACVGDTARGVFGGGWVPSGPENRNS